MRSSVAVSHLLRHSGHRRCLVLRLLIRIAHRHRARLVCRRWFLGYLSRRCGEYLKEVERLVPLFPVNTAMKFNIAGFLVFLSLSAAFVGTKFEGILDGTSVTATPGLVNVPSNTVRQYWASYGCRKRQCPLLCTGFVAHRCIESPGNGETLLVSSSLHGKELTKISVVLTVLHEL